MNTSHCDNDPDVVYTGHSLISRREHEKRMKNEIQSCYIDYPGTTPWFDPLNPQPFPTPVNPVYPDRQLLPYIPPQQWTILSTTLTITPLPSKWARTDTKTHVKYAIDLPGVVADNLSVYVERGTLYVSSKRTDTGLSSLERIDLPLAEIDQDDVYSKFETCVLHVSFRKRKQSRTPVKVTE